nr:galactokinase [Calditrichia bacterium]
MTHQPIVSRIKQQFDRHFGGKPLLVRSPGRVNLIGEHTDYNDGFVLPAAIDKALYFALSLNGGKRGRLVAADYQGEFSFDAGHPEAVREPAWSNYLIGVVAQFKAAGIDVPGFDCVFGGDIPIGAGLSSSAALECGLAVGLNALLGAGLPPMQLIRMAQKAEHDFAGVQCGIMDQFACVFGREGQVVRLDCRSMDYQHFPFEAEDYRILLCDTRVSHSLAGSEYNQRRRECAEGVAILQRHHPAVKSLRDADPAMLEAHRQAFSDPVWRRCHYVVSEIARVEAACLDLAAGRLETFGEKMYETHRGLQHDYAVSCPELDFLVEATRDHPGVLG